MDIKYLDFTSEKGFAEDLLSRNSFFKEIHSLKNKTYTCFVKKLNCGYCIFVKGNYLRVFPNDLAMKLYEDTDIDYFLSITKPNIDIHFLYDIFDEDIPISILRVKIENEDFHNRVPYYWNKLDTAQDIYKNNRFIYYYYSNNILVDNCVKTIRGYYGRLMFYTSFMDYKLEEV